MGSPILWLYAIAIQVFHYLVRARLRAVAGLILDDEILKMYVIMRHLIANTFLNSYLRIFCWKSLKCGKY